MTEDTIDLLKLRESLCGITVSLASLVVHNGSESVSHGHAVSTVVLTLELEPLSSHAMLSLAGK